MAAPRVRPPEDAECIKLVEAIEAYEAKRWPDGKIPSGKS